MSPLIPKGKRPWTVDPGHIHDAPEPPPMPDEQELVGVDIPPEEIEVLQATYEQREPHGEPAPVPEPAEVEVPKELAEEIRRAMKRYPRKRSAAMPALWAVQRRYGWCTPEGIRQAAAVMGVTPGYLEVGSDLLRPLPARAARASTRCSSAPTSAAGCAAPTVYSRRSCKAAGIEDQGTSEDGKLFVRGFECLGGCDLAPMASIDERYYGPLSEDDAEAAAEQLRSGAGGAAR